MNAARFPFGLTCLTLSMAVQAAPVELVSSSWDDASPAGGRLIDISSDGRYVVFSSDSANIVMGDTNGARDVFLRDRATGKTTRVSVSSADIQANGPSGEFGSVTPDGRFVSFSSAASNLVAGDTNGLEDVFVRDTVAGTTELVSVSNSGVQGNGPAIASILSHDGRFVLFDSEASNYFPSETWAPTVYVRDRLHRTTLVAGDDYPTSVCYLGGFSADGNLAAFNCVKGKTDIYVRNLTDGSVGRVTKFPQDSTNVTWASDLSGDGRYVAFTTDAKVLPADTNGTYDAYLYDRKTRVFELVSATASGLAGNDSSGPASVSDYGRFVAFFSWASNLVNGDERSTADGFVRDRFLNTTTRMTGSSFGGLGAGGRIIISGDGRSALFTTDVNNFVANDTNDQDDTFVVTNSFDVSGSFTVRPRTLIFATLPVGSTSAPQRVTITNTGTTALPIAWIHLVTADANEFKRVRRNCPDVLPVAQRCTATVTFAPDTPGAHQARLAVAAGGRRKSVTVSGIAE
jgi:TolB protein